MDEHAMKLALATLKDEVNRLKTSTTARLLIQDGKIADTVIYIKNNLSAFISDVFSTMSNSAEIDELIKTVIINEANALVKTETINEVSNMQDKIVFDNIKTKVIRNDEIGVTYILTTIKNNLKPHVNFTNGTQQNPYSNHRNVIDYMKRTDKPMAINAGLRGVTVKDGISHIEENTDTNEGFYILCIDKEGNFVSVPRTTTATEIISLGYVDAINIWSPVIENGVAFDERTISSAHEDYDYIFNQKHPRQIVGQKYNGDYIVVTIDGRMIGEAGATFADIKQIMLTLDCENAYNLDGGASTQTVIGKHLLNRKLSDSRTIGTVITFESEV